MSDATGFTLLVFLSVLAILIWLLPVAGKWKVYGKRAFLMAYLIVLICSWAFCWVDTVGVLLALAQFVMTIIVLNDLSHVFGKDTGYAIGLVIFGFVFWTMLGFGASEPVRLDDESE